MTITPQQRLTALKHLANGKPARLVATITHLPIEYVDDLAVDTGHPDLAQVAKAADRLAAELDEQARNTMRTPLQTLPTGPRLLHPKTPAAATSTPAAAGTRPAAGTGGEATQQPATRTCTRCDRAKPITAFYEQKGGRDGRMAACMECNNRRPPTETRLLRNRARSRAYAQLAELHAVDYQRLYEVEYEKARLEHATVKAAAGGNPDAATARLKPGPRRAGEQATDRLDVARCTTCHTHHDAGHECPNCGDPTPEIAPTTKPWQVRAWAIEQGLEVPGRGPIPAAVQAAYDAQQMSERSSA